MLGLMQHRPLLISTLVDYAARWHGDREIVSATGKLLKTELRRSFHGHLAVTG